MSDDWPPIHTDFPPPGFSGGDYDFVVIGGGTAGVAGALLGAQLGAKTLLVERTDGLGGESLERGTIPRSTLLAASRARAAAYSQMRFGLPEIEDFPHVSVRKLFKHVKRIQDVVGEEVELEYFERRGIEILLASEAKFITPDTLDVNGHPVNFKKVLISTGSIVNTPREYRKVGPLTLHTIWNLTIVPEYLVIIGAGREAVEWAQLWRRMGAAVTIVAGQSGQVLPNDDPELGDMCKAILQAEGIEIISGKTRKIEVSGQSGQGKVQGDVDITLPDGTSRNASHLLIATGRMPGMEGLNLEDGGIEFDGKTGYISVDDTMKSTSNSKVYAAGEVLGKYPFTHTSQLQGWVAAEHAFTGVSRKNARFKFDPDRISWSTMISPELAHVGISEAEARRRYAKKVVVYKWDAGALDRAVIEDHAFGFIKIVCKGDVIIGAELASPNASDLIQIFALAVQTEASIQSIIDSMAIHPSYASSTLWLGIESFYETWLTPKYRKGQKKLSGNVNLERM